MSVTISLNSIDEAKIDLSLITKKLQVFINNSNWNKDIKDIFFALLSQKHNLRERLNDYFDDNILSNLFLRGG